MTLLRGLVIAGLATGLTGPAAGADSDGTRGPLEGVWRIVEITTVTREGHSRNSQPQPGLYMFTHGYYSAVWTAAAEPRALYSDRWRPTDEEKVRAYDSIVVNAGTYELTETQLITRPIIARVPGFAGGKAVYRYTIDGDNLSIEMVEEYSRDGARATWLDSTRLPLKLVRVEGGGLHCRRKWLSQSD